MDEKNIRYLLRNIQVSVQRASYTGSKARTRWLNISCPFAEWTHAKKSDDNPSFGITINDEDRSHYKCFSCQMKGRLAGLPGKLAGYRKRDYTKWTRWAEMAELSIRTNKPIPEWEEDDDPLQSTASEAEQHRPRDVAYRLAFGLPYLSQRGFGFTDVIRLDLRFDPLQYRVLFPVYRDGNFMGYTGRKALDRKKWPRIDPKVRDYFGLDKRKVLLGARYRREGPLILSEGLFDYARIRQAGFDNAQAILGTAYTPEKGEILKARGEPVFLFMDNDLAGWQAAFGTLEPDGGTTQQENSWAYQLYQEVPVWIVPYPSKSLDGSDPGSSSHETIKRAFQRAWLFSGVAPLEGVEPTFRRPKTV